MNVIVVSNHVNGVNKWGTSPCLRKLILYRIWLDSCLFQILLGKLKEGKLKFHWPASLWKVTIVIPPQADTIRWVQVESSTEFFALILLKQEPALLLIMPSTRMCWFTMNWDTLGGCGIMKRLIKMSLQSLFSGVEVYILQTIKFLYIPLFYFQCHLKERSFLSDDKYSDVF